MKFFLFLSLFASTTLFAETITIDNQTKYPDKKSNAKIGIQWASSSKEMNQKSIDTMYQNDEPLDTLLSNEGKNKIEAPSDAKYFRLCICSSKDSSSDYVTSWVLIVADKSYTLEQENFYPAVLSSGSGC